MSWALWAFLLFLQNFTSAINSRAKNQDNLRYTLVTALATNAAWMASSILMVDNSVKALRSGDMRQIAFIILFYAACTCAGTLTAQLIAMRWIEPRLKRQ